MGALAELGLIFSLGVVQMYMCSIIRDSWPGGPELKLDSFVHLFGVFHICSHILCGGSIKILTRTSRDTLYHAWKFMPQSFEGH